MTSAPSLNPSKISVNVIRREVESGMLAPGRLVAVSSLKDKIDEYLLRLGQASGDGQAIFVELLTRGKVSVHFRGYTERMELVRSDNRMSVPLALMLYSEYLREPRGGREEELEAPTRICRVQRGASPMSKLRRIR